MIFYNSKINFLYYKKKKFKKKKLKKLLINFFFKKKKKKNRIYNCEISTVPKCIGNLKKLEYL